MTTTNMPLNLPDYDTFVEAISILALPISASELHGMMCGYLCAGALKQGETYLRALMSTSKNKELRLPTLALFGVYAVSQQQLSSFDFSFQLLLPADESPLNERAQALGEWCEGFTQSLTLSGIEEEDFQSEDAQDALTHLVEFAELDYQGLRIDESDEKAYMEVSEYARMAVLDIYTDLQNNRLKDTPPDRSH